MPPVDVRMGSEAVSLPRAPESNKLFEALAAIPSYTVPRPRKTSDVRRLMKLARLLAHDELDDDAPELAMDKLLAVFQAQHGKLRRSKRYRELVEERSKVEIKAVNFAVGTEQLTEGSTLQLDVSAENLEDMFEAAGRRIGEGVHKAWWRARVAEDLSLKERAKLEFIALCYLEDDVVAEAEDTARKLIQTWHRSNRQKILALPEQRRQEYDEIMRLASDPEVTSLVYPDTIEGKKGEKTWKKHVYANGGGNYPSELNNWESSVIAAEIVKPDVVGWLRNPERKLWSFCVPYQSGGQHKPLYPDFLVIRKEGGNFVVDLLDPHMLSLEDAPAKAAGLAQFAAKHLHQFGRIELIILDGDKIKRLDLADEATRNKVRAVTSHEHLRQLYGAAES